MHVTTAGQYLFVYNAFSFTLATMSAAALFLWISRSQVGYAYKTALTVSGLVCAIAAYHYFRIFQSWEGAYHLSGDTLTQSDHPFNDAYRYVDWLLTVPLLLIELILVMRLPEKETIAKSTQLGLAAMLMIALGYPGEISDNNVTRALWGTASTVPFVFILYTLYRGLGESIKKQPDNVRDMVKKARLLTLASWGFYPIVYMTPFIGAKSGGVEVGLQVGYTLADIFAKAGFGILIYNIAVRKSAAEYGEPK